jgi:formylglycine-generating enzyme required for sulfatase activity
MTTMNTPHHFCSRSRIAHFLRDRNMKSLRVLLSAVVAIAMAFGVSPSTAQGQVSCAGDVNGDRVVNGNDLAIVLSSWGPCPGTVSCAGDVNGDGVVNGNDLAIVLSSWGPCPPIVPTWATLIEAMPNPAVVTDVTLRNAIIASGFAWRIRDNGTQIEMVLVPGGTFTMGCTRSNLYPCTFVEYPTHSVTITNAFYMGRYEVTQAQWQAQMGLNPSFFQGPSYPNAASRPVEQVSWDTIQNFNSATGLRLPTEAEWEFACRAGTTTAFHGFTGYLSGTNDDNLVSQIAWYSTNSGIQHTHAVGGKAGNGLGLHDMSGNVWEWCSDYYGDYPSTRDATTPVTNPTGPATGSTRVIRGGSWSDTEDFMRSSDRRYFSSGYSRFTFGFRVARSPS